MKDCENRLKKFINVTPAHLLSSRPRDRRLDQRPVIYAVTLASPRCNDNSDKLQFLLQAQILELPENNTISKTNDFTDSNAR